MPKRKPGEPYKVKMKTIVHPCPDAYAESDVKVFEVKPGLFAAVKTIAGYGANATIAKYNLESKP